MLGLASARPNLLLPVSPLRLRRSECVCGNEGYGAARELLACHSGMRVILESIREHGRGLLQVRTEIAEVGFAEQGGLHEALRARA